MRLAMWSGPRNVSTAFMRSWGSRDDTLVVDEPFYAHYLRETGVVHPGREEVIAAQENDWRRVVDALLAPVPEHVRVLYQKQMAHHLLPGMGREWLASMTHAFLIREPRPMLASLAEKLGEFSLLATGLPQQVEIFEYVRRRSGRVPPVVDARDLLERPEATLRALCAALGLPFQPAMLRWPAGPRATDGVWARHWYARVEASTGFEPAEAERPVTLTAAQAALEVECRPLYEQLHAHRLQP
jgi:Sulfotransferase domain